MNQMEKRQTKRIQRHLKDVLECLHDLCEDLQTADGSEMETGRVFWKDMLYVLKNVEISIGVVRDYMNAVAVEMADR